MPGLTEFIISFVLTLLFSVAGTSKIISIRHSYAGGAAVFSSFVISSILSGQLTTSLVISIIGGAIMFVWGYFKEISPLSKGVNFFAQSLAALLFLIVDARVEELFGIHIGVGSIPATLFLLIGVAGITNRMTNLDRLLSLLILVVVFLIGFTSWQTNVEITGAACALAGGITGFQLMNFLNGKIGMGESGRLSIGYILAALSVVSLDIKWVVLYLHLILIITAIYRRRTT